MNSPDQVADAWDKALAADRPVLYEAVTDPEVPPLPPHIRFEQAKQMTQALLKRDPNAARIIKQLLKGKVQESSPASEGQTTGKTALFLLPDETCVASSWRIL